MGESSVLTRQQSIENEPRTLNIDQIRFAREAAMYVMNTKSVEEALRIFTEGLKPVVNGTRGQRRGEIVLMELESGDEAAGGAMSNSTNLPLVRDIVSAPF